MSANRNRAWLVGVGVAFAGAWGCAGSEMRSKVEKLERTLDGVQRDLALARTRLDDMANQVALLTVRRMERRADSGAKDGPPRGGEGGPKDASGVASAVGRAQAGGRGGAEDEKIRSLSVEKVRRRARVSLGPEPGERPLAAGDRRDDGRRAEEERETGDANKPATEASAPKSKVRDAPDARRRVAVATASSRARATDGGVQKAYAAARKLFESRRYLDAISAFTDIAQRHADHPLVENATFWIGAAYFARGEFALALREFERVVSDFAKGRKGADAIYRAGVCHLKLGAAPAARARFLAVVDRFPSSDAAKDARRALLALGKE